MKDELKTLNVATLKTMCETLKKAKDNIQKIGELRTASLKTPKVLNNAGDLNIASQNANINIANLDEKSRKEEIKKMIKSKGLANSLAETFK